MTKASIPAARIRQQDIFDPALPDNLQAVGDLVEGTNERTVNSLFRSFELHDAGRVVAVRRFGQLIDEIPRLRSPRDDVRFSSRVFYDELAARKGDLTVLRIDTDLLELVAEDFGTLEHRMQRRVLVQQKLRPPWGRRPDGAGPT